MWSLASCTATIWLSSALTVLSLINPHAARPDFWLLPFQPHPPSGLCYRPHCISPHSTLWPPWHPHWLSICCGHAVASENFTLQAQQSPPSQLCVQYFLATNARLGSDPGPLHSFPVQCSDHRSLQKASLLLWSQLLPPPKRRPSLLSLP